MHRPFLYAMMVAIGVVVLVMSVLSVRSTKRMRRRQADRLRADPIPPSWVQVRVDALHNDDWLAALASDHLEKRLYRIAPATLLNPRWGLHKSGREDYLLVVPTLYSTNYEYPLVFCLLCSCERPLDPSELFSYFPNGLPDLVKVVPLSVRPSFMLEE